MRNHLSTGNELLPQRGNRFTRWLGRTVLGALGWRLEGHLPDRARMVLIGAPHTSNWDFVLAMATAFALGVEIHWLGKHTLFRPPFAPLMRWLGGIPVDRRVKSGVVSQSVEAIHSRDQMLLCIAPEGTRGRVRRWKTGFYYIARDAGLPILLCHLHYPRRILGFGPTFHPGSDADGDLAAIRAHYQRFRGRRGTREADHV